MKNQPETVTATWGPMKFSPIKYYTFDVGPFVCTTQVGEGETPKEAFARAQRFCAKHAVEAFKDSLETFLEFTKLANEAAR